MIYTMLCFCVYYFSCYLLSVNVLDENYNKTGDEASSPSKKTKGAVEITSPSVMSQRLPLSPRKDNNLTSPVRQCRGRSSAPNTLPKTSSQNVVQTLGRTRRNLASSFANVTSDSTSSLQQRCNSVDEIRDKAHIAATSTTPSKSHRKFASPSKTVVEPTRSTTTPSKTAGISKHELATMRLIKDAGKSLNIVVICIYLQ